MTTFTSLKDASAEHYFDAIDRLRAIKVLLEFKNPPLPIIEEKLEGIEGDLNEWLEKLDSAAMDEQNRVRNRRTAR